MRATLEIILEHLALGLRGKLEAEYKAAIAALFRGEAANLKALTQGA